MNKEEIDKWLDNEYGVSYTSLEEIHDWLVDENIKKDKEIERLQDMDKILRNENINLKLRINKAIEYLELRRYSNEKGEPSLDLDEYDCVPLLNILQGSDKE